MLRTRPVINHNPEIKRLYWIWNSMIRRCHDPKNKAYPRYGGRGIFVCDRWRSEFWTFHDDVMPRPDGSIMDRIDNDKGYEPGNWRWTDYQGSNSNREWCIYIDGMTLKEYMRKTGQISRYRMVTKRIKKGMPVQDALSAPPRLWNGVPQ